MLAFGQYQRDSLAFDMDAFDAINDYHNSSYLYYQDPSTAMMSDMMMKQEVNRSASCDGSLANFSQMPEHPPTLASSGSAPSIPSACSSTMGSPYTGPHHSLTTHDTFSNTDITYTEYFPTIIPDDGSSHDIIGSVFDAEHAIPLNDKVSSNCVDPSLITPPRTSVDGIYPEQSTYPAHLSTYGVASPIGSPAPSLHSYSAYPHTTYPSMMTFQAQPTYNSRRPSVVSSHYTASSHPSPRSESESEGRDKGYCETCGKGFKDLKAHRVTHQRERPEKCPIPSCEYNQKGFARKYDKDRHVLIHFKGTMVCGFCPKPGEAKEQTFNRADVFKRHLLSAHGVLQSAPNSRKRSSSTSQKNLSSYGPLATGKCSNCSTLFNNAEDFYEHLDKCVLNMVNQVDRCEAINEELTRSMADDQDVIATMERHNLKLDDNRSYYDVITKEEEDDEEGVDEDVDDLEEDPSFNARAGKGGIKLTKSSNRAVLNARITKFKGASRKVGMTWSKGGVSLGKGRKKRKDYPPSWGMAADKMQMKKRVLCVYDGSRRLWKDDLMMHNEFEVRMRLGDSNHYVTDLDVVTLRRAEAIHNATDEEKGQVESLPDHELESLMS